MNTENILIIGAGKAGSKLIEIMRRNDFPGSITLIDKRDYIFNKADFTRFPAAPMQGMQGFAAKNKIKFIQGCVERVNLQRKKVYLKDGEAVNFDKLVIASGLESRHIEVKGDHREGFFYLSNMEPKQINDLLKINKDVTVYVSTFLGIELAVSLSLLGKDVRIVASNLDFLEGSKDEAVALLREYAIDVYLNAALDEVIGEGMIKAVRILPLKIFPSQLVFVDSGFLPNRDFCDELPLEGNSEVFFLGDAGRKAVENNLFLYGEDDYIDAQAEGLCGFIMGKGEFNPQVYCVACKDKGKALNDIYERLKAGKTGVLEKS